MASSTLPYHGSERRLVLGMDIGTTFSGISYAFLDPGEIPTIRGITRFPAQENVGPDSKIPSILYYDRQGKVRAVGAEALQESIIEQAVDDGWVKMEWWILHLRPKRLASSHVSDSDLPALPPNKTAVEVLSDFMKYLLHCAQKYITDTYSEIWWNSVANNIDFVLTHPNGWEGTQQSEIRRAAVLAGLVSDTLQGQSRIQLLTDAKASLHYCIANDPTLDSMDGRGIIIVNAGEGTINLSAYCMSNSPLSFEEIAPTECRLQGSVFVTRRARTFLAAKLANSRYNSPEDLANMTSCFDKTTMRRFRNPDEPSYIKFGGVRDRDPAVGIKSGQLKLPGTEVAALFEPSVQSIIEAIDTQRDIAKKPISAVFLVGDFAANDWVFSQLQAHLAQQGITFSRPDDVTKSIADGAISFYLGHRVSAPVRVSSKTYGMKCSTIFKRDDPEHRARKHTLYTGASGQQYVQHKFTTILPKGAQISEDGEFQRTYCQTRRKKELDSNNTFTIDIICYHGALEAVQWTDMEPEMFSALCTIEVDMAEMTNASQALYGPEGVIFYQLDLTVVLQFGIAELKAKLCWNEDGQEKQIPARVVYASEMTISDG